MNLTDSKSSSFPLIFSAYLCELTMPYSPSDFTSSTTVSSMDASSELTYTGFVLAAAASQNIDDFAEEGN